VTKIRGGKEEWGSSSIKRKQNISDKSFLNVERRWELIIQSLSEIKINVFAEK
jgi:hypothetical protein